MASELRYLRIAIKRLFKSVLGIQEGTDIKETVKGIQKDIRFRGHTAWILIFSILIASIGLNVNSTAVIIGAMLISPLMGPILGVGLSIGTNDFETLFHSLKNLGLAITISLFTSTFYFILTPLDIEQSEILSRTKPTLLDVLIALFGGFAGIIAGSRKEKSNVIPGVAIATALMPPLCTAGYGLANLKFEYFFGAFYLFFINSVFISFSTFIVVRYLKFPVKRYVSVQKIKRYKIILSIFLIATVTPSVYIFYKVIQEARFTVAAEKFITEKCKFEGSELLSHKLSYSDTLSVIDLYYIGNKIEKTKKQHLEDLLQQYGFIKNKLFPLTKSIEINIHQGSSNDIDIEKKLSELNNNLRIKILEDIYSKSEDEIKSKDQKISILEKEVVRLSQKDTLPLSQLSSEIKYHIPIFEKFAYSRSIEVVKNNDTSYYDTIPVFLIQLKRNYKQSYKNIQIKKAEDWLKVRLSNNKIKVIEY